MRRRRAPHPSRTNPPRWRALRRGILDAAGWRCAKCDRYGNEVDHVIPIWRGGDPWEPSNLQCLCRGCHIAKSASEARRPDPPRDAWRALVDELTR